MGMIMSKPGRNNVFLSYASEDLDRVSEIYDGLNKRGLDVWFDKASMKPGPWKKQVLRAINRSRFFVICISKEALRKTGDEPGFQDEELTWAYNIAVNQPDETFDIVPVRLEPCDRGDTRLTTFHQYDLFHDFEKDLDALAVLLGGFSLSDALAEDERTEEEKMSENLFNRATAAYYAGDYKRAIAFLETLLVLVPKRSDPWNNKGVALAELGRHDEAIEAYDKALEINPEGAEAWNNKGAALAKLRRHDEAIEACDKALEINPEYAKAWSNKGVALAELGRHAEAIEAYDRALEINP